MLLRFHKFGNDFGLNVTRWFFLTNHAYAGERTWYMRLGRRPGRIFQFGKVR